MIEFYRNELGIRSMTRDSRRHLGLGMGESEDDAIVRSDVLVASWEGGSVTTVDCPAVGCRMLLHRYDNATSGEIEVVVAIQGTGE